MILGKKNENVQFYKSKLLLLSKTPLTKNDKMQLMRIRKLWC